MRRRAERARWREGFPPVLRNGDLGELQSHEDYEAAKTGSPEAALALSRRVVRQEMLEDLVALANQEGATSPRIVPVVAEEARGRNWIPLMAAEVIGHRLGWDVETDIVQATKAGRTGKGADYRLVHHPAFAGSVTPGGDYVILDDTLSMGGTLASLHGYIANRGGRVLGASAMTAHPGALQLPVTSKLLHRIDARHGPGMNALCEELLGYGLDYLTQGEAGHFRTAASVEVMRERLLAQSPVPQDPGGFTEVELLLEALEGQQSGVAREWLAEGWQAYGRRDVEALRRCVEGISQWSADRSLPPLLKQQLHLAGSSLGVVGPRAPAAVAGMSHDPKAGASRRDEGFTMRPGASSPGVT